MMLFLVGVVCVFKENFNFVLLSFKIKNIFKLENIMFNK